MEKALYLVGSSVVRFADSEIPSTRLHPNELLGYFQLSAWGLLQNARYMFA
jgi:hypothetical protein